MYICIIICCRYSELLEGMKSFSPDVTAMPKLGPYIHPPSLYHSQEVYCILTLRIFIARPYVSNTIAPTTNTCIKEYEGKDEPEREESTKQQLCQVDTRYVSVLCNLDIPSQL